MRPGWRDGTGWGEILAPRPPAPCSQPRYSLPDELRRFLFHLPEGTHRLVFLHGEIKAVREKVKKKKKKYIMPASLHPLLGKGAPAPLRRDSSHAGSAGEYCEPDLRPDLLWVFICWACSLASEEVSLALRIDLTLSAFPVSIRIAGTGKSARFSLSPALSKTPAFAENPPEADHRHVPRGNLAAAEDAAASLVPQDPARRCSGIPVRDGWEDVTSRERRKGQEVL